MIFSPDGRQSDDQRSSSTQNCRYKKVHLLLLNLINPVPHDSVMQKPVMNSGVIWAETGNNDKAKNDNMFGEIKYKDDQVR